MDARASASCVLSISVLGFAFLSLSSPVPLHVLLHVAPTRQECLLLLILRYFLRIASHHFARTSDITKQQLR